MMKTAFYAILATAFRFINTKLICRYILMQINFVMQKVHTYQVICYMEMTSICLPSACVVSPDPSFKLSEDVLNGRIREVKIRVKQLQGLGTGHSLGPGFLRAFLPSDRKFRVAG